MLSPLRQPCSLSWASEDASLLPFGRQQSKFYLFYHFFYMEAQKQTSAAFSENASLLSFGRQHTKFYLFCCFFYMEAEDQTSTAFQKSLSRHLVKTK